MHLFTAGLTLERWQASPQGSPFDPHDPSLVHDFLAGTMAPDMGFVVGVDRLLSELAHYVTTGDLLSNMLARAKTEGEKAFTWGWAAHHLTDILIHPMVGRGVGEVLYNDPDRRVNASENEEVHVSVEVGLDVLISIANPMIPRPVSGVLEAGRVDFLAQAFVDTYGVPVDPQRLAADLRRSGRQMAMWPWILKWVAMARLGGLQKSPRGLEWLARQSLSASERLSKAETALRGLCTPRIPPKWLPPAVEQVAATFPDRFNEVVQRACFENRNLETGLKEHEPVDHANTELIHKKLVSLRKPIRDHTAFS